MPNVEIRGDIDPGFAKRVLMVLQMLRSSSTAPSVMRKICGIEQFVLDSKPIAYKKRNNNTTIHILNLLIQKIMSRNAIETHPEKVSRILNK